MLAHRLALRMSRPSPWYRSFSIITLGVAPMLSACAPIAGLDEHLPYVGFPDSLSVPCSDGTTFVDCESVRNTIPQDGHFAMAQPSFQVSGNEVIDSITGLTWYRLPGEPQIYETATKYCDVLPGDYRLPTRIELVSLLDFRADSPARIDQDVFPDIEPAPYWTSSAYGTDAFAYWSVNFCAGCPSDPPLLSRHALGNAGAFCVKSEGEPFAVGPFEIAGEENRFVRDTRTGLMWMKQVPETGDIWVDAADTCLKALDGGYGDFRLPNTKELATLVDEKKSNNGGSALHDVFEVGSNRMLWSSTPTRAGNAFFHLNVAGGSAGIMLGASGYLFPLCVRGPD